MPGALLPATFPAEAVPDGTSLTIHHYIYPLLGVLVATSRIGDDWPTRDPWIVTGGVVLGLFGFLLAWPSYPVLGASLSRIGLAVAFAGLCRPAWGTYWPRRYRIGVWLLLVAAADDWFSHALGWWTPLDWIFHQLPLHLVAAVAVIGAAAIVAGLRLVPEPRPRDELAVEKRE